MADNPATSRHHGNRTVMVAWLAAIGNSKVFFIWRVMVVIFPTTNHNIIAKKKI